MRYALFGLAAVASLYCLHRLRPWAERRGWIYYRKKHGSSGTLSNAVLEVHSLSLDPSKRYVLEEKTRDQVEDEESGDPPTTREGGRRPPNKGMKQTKPAQAMELRSLSPVFGRPLGMRWRPARNELGASGAAVWSHKWTGRLIGTWCRRPGVGMSTARSCHASTATRRLEFCTGSRSTAMQSSTRGTQEPRRFSRCASHLISLCLVLERGLAVGYATRVMGAATRTKERFFWLTPPKSLGELTVSDVVEAATPFEHEKRVRAWADAAWSAWAEHHATVRAWIPA